MPGDGTTLELNSGNEVRGCFRFWRPESTYLRTEGPIKAYFAITWD